MTSFGASIADESVIFGHYLGLALVIVSCCVCSRTDSPVYILCRDTNPLIEKKARAKLAKMKGDEDTKVIVDDEEEEESEEEESDESEDDDSNESDSE